MNDPLIAMAVAGIAFALLGWAWFSFTGHKLKKYREEYEQAQADKEDKDAAARRRDRLKRLDALMEEYRKPG